MQRGAVEAPLVTRRTDPPGRAAVARRSQQQHVAVSAGRTVVTAARVGRLLGRTGWRMARQLPGVSTIEAQALRLGQTLTQEFARLLEMPQGTGGAVTTEELRAMKLITDAGANAEPLRSAMTELLERSAEQNGTQSREYLYGTIVSQLVPDEARILAALAGGRSFAVVDVLARHSGRSTSTVELANASTVGTAAGVSLPANTSTYLTRLHGFGLVEFGPATDDLASEFVALGSDPAVRAARSRTDNGKTRSVRKSVKLSEFGAEFWSACSPSAARLARRRR